MCIVQKMFHKFNVDEPDRNYLRLFWWKGGNLDKKHLKHLEQEHSKEYPLDAQFVNRNFYVDDGVTSLANTEDAIRLATEARKLCAKGGLRRHKFMSNDTAVMESIPASEHAEVKVTEFTFDEKPLGRTPGFQWHRESDSLFRI